MLQETAQETEMDTPGPTELDQTPTGPTPAPTAPNSKDAIPEQAPVEQLAESGAPTPEVPDGWGQGLDGSLEAAPASSKQGASPAEKTSMATPEKKNKGQDMGFQPPTSPPPQRLSRLAADQRLRRTMQPRANGTFKVPKIIRNKWANLATRDEVFALFEKSGYDADSCFENLQLFSKGLVVSVDVSGFVSFIYIYIPKTPQQNE